MERDKKLEELFLAQKPTFDDKAQFMAQLTRRLDAVEYVRQHQEATLRHYKMAMVVAFVVGIVSGVVTMAFVLSTPADVPLFTFSVESSILLWIAENSRLIATTAIALLMSFGIMSIISNVQDILAIRHNSIHIIEHYGN
jgi:cell division protein FtsX